MIKLASQPTTSVTRTVTGDVTVSLNDFSDEAIIAYLRDRGYAVDGERKAPIVLTQRVAVDDEGREVLVFYPEDLDRIATLALCGQRDAARELIINQVSDHIRRSL